MKNLRNFFDQYVPMLLGACWVLIITLLSIAGLAWSVKMVMKALGVL